MSKIGHITATALTAVLLVCATVTPPHAQSRNPAGIGQDQYLQGQFSMDRHLAGFDKPLTSEGEFTLSPATGLIWHTITPFPGMTVLDDHGITRIDDQNNRENLAGGDQFRPFIELISAVLAGNWDPLRERFDIVQQTAKGNDPWQIVLTPKGGSPIAGQISKITATGTQFVDVVQIAKPSGDRDAITLSGQELHDMPLPADLADIFAGPAN
ncbi:outer membrane lipoprotein carrier protein LolA [Thalassospira sp.]|uniref:LolA family protein n=1 Tax=Thalassospira sp. TaxID=1912094 RepID=UPI0027355E70|nr:outer membrane lipoprotein carrier protein LolA [Thalassospira sp.]MDP2698560.1 outer membrane lipoprotein carrier protein LolA [Thalassospira sp.]